MAGARVNRYKFKNFNRSMIATLQPIFHVTCISNGSRSSSGSIVSDYGLDDQGSIPPTEAEDFSSSLCVQTGSGAHPASCTMGTRGPFPGGKAWPWRDADHSPPSSAEVKNE
jgi:hypothetical protein